MSKNMSVLDHGGRLQDEAILGYLHYAWIPPRFFIAKVSTFGTLLADTQEVHHAQLVY